MTKSHLFALGTVQWGLPYGIANRSGQPNRAEVSGMLQLARQAGVDTLDTARVYGDSERIIGALVGSSEHWRVITKLSPNVADGVAGKIDAVYCVKQSIDESRTALCRDRLDVVLLHRAEHRHVLGGIVWDTLIEYRESGVIVKLGVSAGSPKEAFAAIEDPDVKVVQVASNLLDQRLFRSAFYDAASKAGVEVFVRSVFLQGVAFLSPDELPTHLKRLAPTMKAIGVWASDHELSIADAFLLFARDSLGGTTVLGCESVEQLRKNLEVWSLPCLRSEEIEELSNIVPPMEELLVNPAMWEART